MTPEQEKELAAIEARIAAAFRAWDRQLAAVVHEATSRASALSPDERAAQ